MELEEHYGQLLGVKSSWEIASVDLKMQDQRVDIVIEYTDDQGPCPECGAICPKHDNRKKRTWRHLDTMQFSTYLYCEVPRVRCDTWSENSCDSLGRQKQSLYVAVGGLCHSRPYGRP